MAERRMFAKSVIGSARFLRMPSTSRLLYYDLGMQADDDGVVKAFSVMRTTGATEDDLRVLASKGFVSVLKEICKRQIPAHKKARCQGFSWQRGKKNYAMQEVGAFQGRRDSTTSGCARSISGAEDRSQVR